MIGESTDPRRFESTLAVQLDRPSDHRACEYPGAESLYEEARAGRTPQAVRWPVFDSYAALLGHVVALRIDGIDTAAVRGIP